MRRKDGESRGHAERQWGEGVKGSDPAIQMGDSEGAGAGGVAEALLWGPLREIVFIDVDQGKLVLHLVGLGYFGDWGNPTLAARAHGKVLFQESAGGCIFWEMSCETSSTTSK